MDYDKIILDLLNRIVTLEDRVSKLEQIDRNTQPNATDIPAGSKKYRFLTDYLRESDQSRVKLSYDEIEEILGFKLPDSAAAHRTFWANTTSHSIALSWLNANYSVAEANLDEKYIVFERKRAFEIVKTGKSTVTTEENHLAANKNHEMVALYRKLKKSVFECIDEIDNVGTGATSYYVSWNVSGSRQRQFANIYIQKEKIRIETLEPVGQYDVGEMLPATRGYPLRYQTKISSEADIEKVKRIILESYNQIKQLV